MRRKMNIVAFSCVVITAFLSAAAAQAGEWRIGVIDPGIGGEYSSLRVDAYGNAHVVYVDSNEAVLKYAFWDQKLDRWFGTPIDRSTGFCSLALDGEQHPHISYLDYGSGRLKYAHWVGGAWAKEALQIPSKQISFYTSIAVNAKANPSITFYQYEGADGEQDLRLRNIAWDGSEWELRTVDPTPGSGKFNSVAFDSEGKAHVAYGNVKYEDASLRYAVWDGRSWNVEVLEGAGRPGTSMWSVVLLLDKSNQPHIAYTDVLNRVVKYATKVNGKWTIESVDSIKKEGYPDRNGLALDSAGNPYISYYDAGSGVLKLAHRVARQWYTEVVDRNYAGFTNSLQIHEGTIWITYADQLRKDLKFARRMIDSYDAAPLKSAIPQSPRPR